MSGSRILVVDDSRQIRTFLRLGLCGQGHEVLEAGSAAEAMAILEPGQPEPDLIILDLGLPDRDGLDLAADLLAPRADGECPPPPILILSVRDDAISRRQARALGVMGYMTKPFRFDELLAAVAELTALPARD